MNIRIVRQESGQALVELSFAFVVLSVFAFGIIDLSRAIIAADYMKGLSGESCRLVSRGASTTTAASQAISGAGSKVDLANQGCVIITTVTNSSGAIQITDQTSQCAIKATSGIGCLKGQAGCQSSTPTLPASASAILQNEVSGSSLYITEIFYNYSPASPIGMLLPKGAVPSQLYSISYF